jgi:hypothetical protein
MKIAILSHQEAPSCCAPALAARGHEIAISGSGGAIYARA